ncbi:UNVERIFIED_CONTAM: hypothetical protein FKN15_067303 [Acipenser sinensis]
MGKSCKKQRKEQLSPQAAVATPLPPLPPGSPPSREIWDWLVHPKGNFASDLPWVINMLRMRDGERWEDWVQQHNPASVRRGQQPCKIRLSVTAVTRRGGEEGVLAFPLSEWLRGRPWGIARPIRAALGCAFGWLERGYPVMLEKDVSAKKEQASTAEWDSLP